MNGSLQSDLISWGEHHHLAGKAAQFTNGVPTEEELEFLNVQRSNASNQTL